MKILALVLFLAFAVAQLRAEPLIVAHRGASDNAPQNTLPSFKLAWEHGADAIEGDFHLTKDGEIVCVHDESTGGVSDINLIVKSSTLEELRRLDVGKSFDQEFQGTMIPTFSEVISTIPEGKKIYIEIKCGPEILPKLFREIENSNLKRKQIVIISFNQDVIREVKIMKPAIKASWLIWFSNDASTGELKPDFDTTLETLKSIKADGVSFGYNAVDESMIRKFRKAGLECHVWTVDHLETARIFDRWGVKSITTNNPYHMKRYLRKPLPSMAATPGKPAYFPYSRLAERERLIQVKLRRGPNYSRRLRLSMNSDYQKGGTVFIGDSAIENFPLDVIFEGKNIINCGTQGDDIMGVAERLDVCVKAAEPEEVYVMTGINDLLRENPETLESLGYSYKKLLRDLKSAAPGAKITVFSILPVCGAHSYKNHLVLQLNKVIENIAQKDGLRYFDLLPFFTNESHELYSHLTTDGLNLSPEGYLVWLKALLDEEDYQKAVVNYSESWLKKFGGFFSVAKVDPPSTGTYPGSRGPDELIIYTPSYEKPSTNTNPWGKEVIVRNGMVEKQSPSDSPIPTDGFVVSGHGAAAAWIEKYLHPGVYVEYDQIRISVGDIPESEMTGEQRLAYLKKCVFNMLYSEKKTGVNQESVSGLISILENILRIQGNDKLTWDKDLVEIADELRQLEIH